MAKIWDEKLNNLSVKLDDLSKKAAEAAGDAKAYHELIQEAIDEKGLYGRSSKNSRDSWVRRLY